MIDLRSDTLNNRTAELTKNLERLKVGDSAYQEDNTITLLEGLCAKKFAKEAGLFLPTGTMANQICLMINSERGDEVLSHFNYHINYFESSQTSALCGLALNLHGSTNGIIQKDDIGMMIRRKPRGSIYAKPRILHLENTVSVTGGNYYSPQSLSVLYSEAKKYGLIVTLDGARIFNAAVASNAPLSAFSQYADTMMFCFSKGLGAPSGAMLLSDFVTIERARKFQKWLGGAGHQVGYIAKICLESIRLPWIDVIKKDHTMAHRLAKGLVEIFGEEMVFWHGTNIVLLKISDPEKHFLSNFLNKHKVYVANWIEGYIRFVTYSAISEEMIDRVITLCQYFLLAHNTETGIFDSHKNLKL